MKTENIDFELLENPRVDMIVMFHSVYGLTPVFGLIKKVYDDGKIIVEYAQGYHADTVDPTETDIWMLAEKHV